jgi:drug/metabolite transporter (DMT)-like permease
MRPPGRLVKAVAIGVMILIWGTTWAVIRVGLEDIPPFKGVAVRFAVAGAVLLGVALALGLRPGGTARERRMWLVHGPATLAIPYSITYWAEQWVPSGLTAVLFATFPLFVALLAHRLLPGERLAPLATLGVLLGFGGVAVIFSEDLGALGGRQVMVASAVMLVAPLVSAVGNVVIKRWGQGVHPVSLNLGGMALTAVAVGALAAAVERGRPIELTATAVASVLYLALFGSAITFCLYFWLIHHMAATQLALIAYAIPVVAVVVGSLAFDEPVTLRIAAGAALVIAGTALASGRRPPARTRREDRPAPEG